MLYLAKAVLRLRYPHVYWSEHVGNDFFQSSHWMYLIDAIWRLPTYSCDSSDQEGRGPSLQ